MQTSMGMLSTITKGDQVSSIAAIWAISSHDHGSHQKKVLRSQAFLLPKWLITLGVSTTKIKYLTEIYMIDQHMFKNICVSQRASCQRGLTQNQNESINNMIWVELPEKSLYSKSRFVISVYE